MSFKNRELIVLLVGAVAVLLSFRYEPAYDFERISSLYISPTHTEKYTNIPEPVVFKDGFRSNSMVVAHTQTVAVYRWKRFDTEFVEKAVFDTTYQPILMSHLSLGPKQFLYVLTEKNYNVTCLSLPDLKPLWSRTLPKVASIVNKYNGLILSDHVMIADNIPIFRGDTGSVFVSIKFQYSPILEELNGNNIIHDNGRKNANQTGEEELNLSDKYNLDTITHTMLIALDSQTGQLRWQRIYQDDASVALHYLDLENMDDDQETIKETDHEYRRHIAERSYAFQESHWKNFKFDFMDSGLPHQWYNSRHSTLSTHYFYPPTQKRPPAKSGTNSLDAYHYFENQSKGNQIQKSKNVLLFGHEQGLTAVHLYTGKIISRLTLSPYQAYADINGDKAIDSVFVDELRQLVRINTLYNDDTGRDHLPAPDSMNANRDQTENLQNERDNNNNNIRENRVRPGHRRRRDPRKFGPLPNLYEVSINPRMSGWIKKSGPVSYSSPLLLPYSFQFRGIEVKDSNTISKAISSLSFERNKDDVVSGYYVVVLDSQGTLWCIDGKHGFLRWTLETQAGWHSLNLVQDTITPEILTRMNRPLKGQFGAGKLDHSKVATFVMPFSFDSRVQDGPDSLLIVTPSAIMAVSNDGSVLAMEMINLPTLARKSMPIIADVTNDGRNDVILVTDSAYLIYSTQSGKSHVFPVLAAIYTILVSLTCIYRLYFFLKASQEADKRAEALIENNVEAASVNKIE